MGRGDIFEKTILLVSLIISLFMVEVGAQTTYTVKSGDSIWKISVKYQMGISEILAKNPQVKNPSLIYPGQKLTIPGANILSPSYTNMGCGLAKTSSGVCYWTQMFTKPLK
ncbi:MAG: SafA/ExsA family spore coat assembly protein [Ruminiclostridium sp.]